MLSGLAGLAGITALSGCGDDSTGGSPQSGKATITPEADGDLNWFTWEDYVEPSVVSDFEKKYGVKVKISPYDSNDSMLQKLAAGVPYDLVTNNSAYMPQSIQGGLLMPFSLDALDNGGEVATYFRRPAYDNGANLYSVPYSGGPTGIVYRTDKMSPTQSWSDLWDNDEAAGHVFVLDYQPDTIGASLLRGGGDLNSSDPDEVGAAVDSLIALKSKLGGISNDTRTNVGNGDAWIHHAWVPDAFYLMKESKYADQLDFEVTSEDGVPFGMDLLSIGANAKAPGTAMLFMDWILSPEMSARNVTYTGQLAGTKGGDAAYDEVMKDFPALMVPENYYENALWREAATGSRKDLWTQQWNRFKAA
ncbi:MAG: spermidine/putrescine ABC transporter substrate-binding protein [Aeromicrobium sp.]